MRQGGIMGTVLIIEDDPGSLSFLKAIFEGSSFTVKVATTFQEFLDLLPALEMPLVALVDEDFPGGNGAQVAAILREKIPGVKLISTSGKPDSHITWKPDARFPKPFSPAQILGKVEEFMRA